MSVKVRDTRQKQAIRQAITAANRPVSPAEVLELAGERVPGISIATVYRNLVTLLEEGWLVAVNLPGKPPCYELAGKHHHHHFQCNACSKVFELEGCDIVPKAKLPPGFRTTSHEFFLYGTCADCR